MAYLDYPGLARFKDKIQALLNLKADNTKVNADKQELQAAIDTKINITDAENIVMVQDEQPTAEYNEIWIKETPQTPVQVPTYTEFQNLVKVQSIRPTEEENKIWIQETAEDELTIPSYEDFQELDNRKLDKPFNSGTAGQILRTDGVGGTSWENPATAEEISSAANTWLQQNITNPSNPPLDRSLSLNTAAAPADIVGELKSAINVVELNLNGEDHEYVPTWYFGYVNGTTGAVVDRNYDNTNRYSDMFHISSGAIITTSYGYNLNIYSYNSSGTFIEKLATIRDNGTPASYTIASDTNIRLSQELASADATASFNPNIYTNIDIPYKRYTLIENLQEQAEVSSKIQEVLEKGNILSDIEWHPGYIDNSGNIHGPYAQNSNLYTDLFVAKKGTTIQNKTSKNGNIFSYSEDGTFIEKLGVIKNWTIYTVSADIYIRISWEYGATTSDTSLGNKNFNIVSYYGETDYGNISRTVKQLNSANGKKIVWFGTSIPAGSNPNCQSYPAMIGEMLGATVYNESVSGSNIRAGSIEGVTESDPMGYQGLNWVGVSRSLSLSSSEKQAIFDNWSTWQPLIQNAPSSAPSSEDQAIMKSYSYDQKVAKYLPGGSVGVCDLYVIDHGYNDWGNSTINNNEINTIPTDHTDRRYFIGAMNFITEYILKAVPHAKILFIGNLIRDPMTPLTEAQKKVRDLQNRPLAPVWEYTGFSNEEIITTGYWDANNVWQNSGGSERTIRIRQMYLRDNTHPHEDYSGYALRVMATAIYPFIRDVIIHT